MYARAGALVVKKKLPVADLQFGMETAIVERAGLVGLLQDVGMLKIPEALRVTPAMQAGIADHVWTLEEIAKLAN